MPTSYENEINARKTWELLQPELKYGGAVDPLPGMMQEVAPLKAAKSLPFIVKVVQLLDSLKRNEPDFEQDYDAGVATKLDKKISNKDTVFHSTRPHNLDSIIKQGKIKPSSNIFGTGKGVSVSRTLGDRSDDPVTIELKNSNKYKPVLEYGHSKPDSFEFESRTKNKEVTLDDFKRIILNMTGYLSKENPSIFDKITPEAYQILKEKGIPVIKKYKDSWKPLNRTDLDY